MADYVSILAHFIENAKIKTVLELGVGSGRSSEEILKALPIDSYLWSIDINSCLEAKERLKSFKKKWTFFSDTDDREIDSRFIPDVDMIFIDTSHTYEHTLMELEKFSGKALHWIFLHDTISNPEVTQAIEIFLQNDIKWAWAEWKHRFGMGLLMRINP